MRRIDTSLPSPGGFVAAPTDRTSAGARRRRILAWPREFELNPVPGMIYDGLERWYGWQVLSFSYRRAVLGRYVILVSFPNEPFRNRSKVITVARAALAVFVIGLAKARGKKLVWTVHNVADHEGYHVRLEARFMAWFTRRVDLTIHLSETGRQLIETRYPATAGKSFAIIPHPHYGSSAGQLPPRDEALRKLGLPPDCRLVLAFGVVRRYKNLLALMRAFSGLPGDKLCLLVAGTPLDIALADAIRRSATDPRVMLRLAPVDPDTLAIYFGAASLVVAPYFDILNSGTALLSLTYGRPILVSNRGAMPELRDQVGDDWVRLFDAPLNEMTLGDALAWAARPRSERPDLARFEPAGVIADYAAVMTKLLNDEPVEAA
jgi:beta-1,4-mannosyltransferase